MDIEVRNDASLSGNGNDNGLGVVSAAIPSSSRCLQRDQRQAMNALKAEDLRETAYRELRSADQTLVETCEDLLKREIPDPEDSSLQQQILAVLMIKQRQILQRRWKLQWGSKSIRMRAQIDNAVRLINVFKDVGTIASKSDPLHAGLPWAGICFFLTVSAMSLCINSR